MIAPITTDNPDGLMSSMSGSPTTTDQNIPSLDILKTIQATTPHNITLYFINNDYPISKEIKY